MVMEAPHDFERRRRVVLLRSGYVARCSARQTLWFDCIWAETPSNIFSGPALRRDTSLQVHRRTFLGGSLRIGQGVLTVAVSVVHAFGVVTTQTMGLSRGPSHVSSLLCLLFVLSVTALVFVLGSVWYQTTNPSHVLHSVHLLRSVVCWCCTLLHFS